jgi:spermidine synthase
MLTFPQPVYPSGWWSATLAGKANPLDGFRAADAATRGFETRYYNAEIHQAALALPEFVRQALT